MTDNLLYTKETDSFVCRTGKQLIHVGNRKYVTEAGYETRRDYYRCEDCGGCPNVAECKNTDKNRTIQVSHRLNELKSKKMRTFAPKKDLSYAHKELWKWNRSLAGSKAVGRSDGFIYVELKR